MTYQAADIVQEINNVALGATSNILTLATATTVGNVLVLLAGNGSGPSVSGVTGGGVTAWTFDIAETDGGVTGDVEIWHGIVTTPGATTVTYTTPSTSNLVGVVLEVSGLTGLVDLTAAAKGSISPSFFPSFTPSDNGELFVFYGVSGNGFGTSPGFLIYTTGRDQYWRTGTNTVPAASAISTAGWDAKGASYCCVMALFKAAASAPGASAGPAHVFGS